MLDLEYNSLSLGRVPDAVFSEPLLVGTAYAHQARTTFYVDIIALPRYTVHNDEYSVSKHCFYNAEL